MLIVFILVLIFLILLGIYVIRYNKTRRNKFFAIEKDKLLTLIFLPKENSKAILAKEIQNTIENVIKKYSLDNKLPYFKNGLPFAYVYIFPDSIASNTSVIAAHQIWNEKVFDKIPTPFNLPRESNKSITPTWMLKVEIQSVRKHCRNWWGYEGYFLSLLIEQNSEIIWDARGGIIGVDI